MIDIKYSEVGATTILECGTTNAGHYAIAQQGLNSYSQEGAKKVYDLLMKYSPIPPGYGWEQSGIKLMDYKSFGNKEFYRIHVEFSFRRDMEKYTNEVQLTPEQAKEVYVIFEQAVKEQRR